MALGALPALASGSSAGATSSSPFVTYPAPDGLATDAGEPSIGVNWNTGNVMFQAYTQTLRVAFDDGTAPATATWVDKSYPLAVTSMDPILYTDSQTGLTMTSQLITPAGVAGVGVLGCSIGATTTDDGESWTPSEGCSTPGGTDHQTVGGGPVVDAVGTEPGGARPVRRLGRCPALVLRRLDRRPRATDAAAVPAAEVARAGLPAGRGRRSPAGAQPQPSVRLTSTLPWTALE